MANMKAIIDEVLKAMGPKILEAVEKATGSSSTASTARPVLSPAYPLPGVGGGSIDGKEYAGKVWWVAPWA